MPCVKKWSGRQANGRRLSAQNFDGENVDKLIKICQIRQYFPCQNFAPYGIWLCMTNSHVDVTTIHPLLGYIYTYNIKAITVLLQLAVCLSEQPNHRYIQRYRSVTGPPQLDSIFSC